MGQGATKVNAPSSKMSGGAGPAGWAGASRKAWHPGRALGYPAVAVRRVLQLPDRGRLIVATDVQGNVADFDRVAAIFEDAAQSREGAYLVVTGDLVHGPGADRGASGPTTSAPSTTATRRPCSSTRASLGARHPGRVHYLLGNHEHAHVGGPVVVQVLPGRGAAARGAARRRGHARDARLAPHLALRRGGPPARAS